MRKLFLLFLFFIPVLLFAQRTLLHCGRLIDVKNGSVRTEQTIIVEGNKISDIQKGYVAGTGADIVMDLKRSTVMPGLIDCHVHMEHETNPNRYLETFTLNPADYAFQSVMFSNRTLMAGFTSVRDLGGSGVNIALRNAINKKLIVGPRVFTAGKSIATTGGHADPTNGYRKDLQGDPGPAAGVANGPDECRKAVRQRYKDGSDLIKITASGGVLSVAKSGENPQFTEDEIKAIVETAKDYGFKVAAHCHGAEAMKRAVRGGVNSIEHGTYMDDEVIALMKQHGTYLVPTIIAGKSVADSAKKTGYYPELVTPKALAIGPKIQTMFAKAYKEGVKIAFGTDAGVYAHGKNWMEFVYMNEAGMPVMKAIQSATVSAADLLGVSDQLGSIEKGKLADIIAVEGDPERDVKVMGKVSFVMKDGVVYKK
ncbi:metal-dependent hydrolase family protein [Pseudoflavitalea rhizosphaerae]|uniref:metal-dependent hydrolase family protein n=1 Tax=Pseudoflavitalea rhizosphaerae TaxID=1884793 RepID=UPI000F8D87AD|nr:amidohydrolase family protein [Pseudoflavitalea rhizosphaerae]